MRAEGGRRTEEENRTENNLTVWKELTAYFPPKAQNLDALSSARTRPTCSRFMKTPMKYI